MQKQTFIACTVKLLIIQLENNISLHMAYLDLPQLHVVADSPKVIKCRLLDILQHVFKGRPLLAYAGKEASIARIGHGQPINVDLGFSWSTFPDILEDF